MQLDVKEIAGPNMSPTIFSDLLRFFQAGLLRVQMSVRMDANVCM